MASQLGLNIERMLPQLGEDLGHGGEVEAAEVVAGVEAVRADVVRRRDAAAGQRVTDLHRQAARGAGDYRSHELVDLPG